MQNFVTQLQIARVVVGTLLCSGPLCAQQESSSSRCLSYEPALVNVGGTLISKTFAGPPNYESVRNGDRAETSWLIELHSPVCVSGDKAGPDLNPSQDRVTEIQLVLTPEEYQTYKGMVGREVIARGTLFGAHTGHHHTPVLLTAKSIEPAKSDASSRSVVK
jgi:hypothetical protein